MIIADDVWKGAGGPIVSGALTLGGVVIGLVVAGLQNRKKDRRDRKRREEELRGSARTVAAAFANAASALRVASKSAGSLDGWTTDDAALDKHVDLIRKNAPNKLWTQIEKAA